MAQGGVANGVRNDVNKKCRRLYLRQGQAYTVNRYGTFRKQIFNKFRGDRNLKSQVIINIIFTADNSRAVNVAGYKMPGYPLAHFKRALQIYPILKFHTGKIGQC